MNTSASAGCSRASVSPAHASGPPSRRRAPSSARRRRRSAYATAIPSATSRERGLRGVRRIAVEERDDREADAVVDDREQQQESTAGWPRPNTARATSQASAMSVAVGTPQPRASAAQSSMPRS